MIRRGLLRIQQLNDFCLWLSRIPQTRIAIQESYYLPSGSENDCFSTKTEISVTSIQSKVYLRTKKEAAELLRNEIERKESENGNQTKQECGEEYGDKKQQCTHRRGLLNLERSSSHRHQLDGRNEKKSATNEEGTCVGQEEEEVEKSTRLRTEMMQNMAQLWLQQEVKELEIGNGDKYGLASGGGSQQSSSFGGGFALKSQPYSYYSPYLIMDHWPLMSCLGLVKDVVAR